MGDGLRHRMVPAALLLLCLICSAAGYCTQGSEWIEYNGHCYHWSRTAVTWFLGELTCRQSGGHLVSIRNLNENNFLLRLTQCSGYFWIGMVNTDYALRGQIKGYEWWDGTQHSYTALVPRTNDFYNCVFGNTDAKWYNYICQASYRYVCMVPAVPPLISDNQSAGPAQAEEAAVSNTSAIADNGVARTTSNWRLVTSPTSSPSKCPSDWQLMDNSCYFVSTKKTNYFNSQMSCQAMGSNVVSVLTLREHTLLTVALGCNSQAWIGLEKARPCFQNPSKDNCWVWMDRNPVNFVEWASGQTTDRRDAECVILDGLWKVVNCYAEYLYICKKPAGR